MPESAGLAAMITIQGVGEATNVEVEGLREAVSARLAGRKGARLYFGSVDYGAIMQQRVSLAGGVMVDAGAGGSSGGGLYVPGEPPVVGQSGESFVANAYTDLQLSIARELHAAYLAGGSGTPVAFVAHGDSCEVFSNYLWDAQRFRESGGVPVGIWADLGRFAKLIAGKSSLSDVEIEFLAGGTLRYFVTTGYNIPKLGVVEAGGVFASIAAPNAAFEWHNFHDETHLIGWRKAGLSGVEGALIRDYEVAHVPGAWAAGGSQLGHLWTNNDVLAHFFGPLGDLWQSSETSRVGLPKTEDVIGSVGHLPTSAAMEPDRNQLLARIKVLFGASEPVRAGDDSPQAFLVLPEGDVPSFGIDLTPYEGEVTPPDVAMARWLDTPNQRFGGCRPREYLEGDGRRRAFLSGVLDAIEDGAFT